MIMDDTAPGTETIRMNEMHTGGMLTGGRDVIIVLGRISGTDEDDLLPLNLDIQVTADVGPIGVASPKVTKTRTFHGLLPTRPRP